jgi:hypothetical protein
MTRKKKGEVCGLPLAFSVGKLWDVFSYSPFLKIFELPLGVVLGPS